MSNLHLVTGYAGQEHITSADQGSFNAAMLGNGEFVLERGNQFAAQVITNNQVRVQDGDILMQGRHIRMTDGTYTDLYFDNGTQGYKRKDLIVVRYEKDATTDIEQANLVVLKGTPSESTPAVPTHTVGDIINEHDLINEMPLYTVEFDGINIVAVSKPLFATLPTWETLKKEALDDINAQWEVKEIEVDEKVAELDSKILNSYAEIEAATEQNLIAGALGVKEGFKNINTNLQSTIYSSGATTIEEKTRYIIENKMLPTNKQFIVRESHSGHTVYIGHIYDSWNYGSMIVAGFNNFYLAVVSNGTLSSFKEIGTADEPLDAHYQTGELDDYLDTTTEPYVFGTSTKLSTLLGTGNFWVNVFTMAYKKYVSQIAVGGAGNIATRYCVNETWGEWKKIPTAENTPTGGGIEFQIVDGELQYRYDTGVWS